MKKNIISIDLDKLVYLDRKEIRILCEHAIVPTPCTLTDAVKWCEKNKTTLCIYDDGDIEIESDTLLNIKQFKENHLYKEETLQDGIYEVEIGNSIQMVYVKGGKWCVTKNGLYFDDTHEFNNPRKIADLSKDK